MLRSGSKLYNILPQWIVIWFWVLSLHQQEYSVSVPLWELYASSLLPWLLQVSFALELCPVLSISVHSLLLKCQICRLIDEGGRELERLRNECKSPWIELTVKLCWMVQQQVMTVSAEAHCIEVESRVMAKGDTMYKNV